MLYSGIQTDDHVYTKCTVLFSLAQIQMLYTHPLSFFYVEAFGPTLVVLVTGLFSCLKKKKVDSLQMLNNSLLITFEETHLIE